MHSFSLVTGATGFVGSQLVRTLLARGEYVKALVRPGSNLAALEGLPSDRFKVAVGDTRIEPSVYAALAGCNRLYHVAANFQMWGPSRARVIAPTVEGMRATLRAAQHRKLEKIVVTSSAGVLGVSSTPEPVDESHPFNLKDPEAYFAAKVAADRVVEEFRAAGLPIVRVLPATIAGPGDWKPTPNGRLLIEYLKTPSTSHFPVSGGGINVVDVEDVASGHVLAMDRGTVGE
ncbi:MAG TPA: NAD-dependent epimerase/dehydratase family protein, partial [Polyangiaceae bacterium]|nr:NAD-dependent epimerase/dehydratase family protein [Polyangiaceae bacterium]